MVGKEDEIIELGTSIELSLELPGTLRIENANYSFISSGSVHPENIDRIVPVCFVCIDAVMWNLLNSL